VGGIIEDERGLLLVENLRRNGSRDWSPPGGVIDPGEGPVEALTREVLEETGLTVDSWQGPIYRVEVEAPDDGFHLGVEVYRAEAASGDIVLDDPDGIVVTAEYVPRDELEGRLHDAHRWITEPVLGFVHDGADDGRTYRFRMVRDDAGAPVVTRQRLD
jgi:8-oxo-dGTP diphosphatase